MNVSKFMIVVLIGTSFSIAMFYALDFAIPLKRYSGFFYTSLLFFILYTGTVYLVGKVSVGSKIKNLFVYLVLYNVIIKLLFAFLIVYIYVKQFGPQSKAFLIPFLLVYLVFTACETYILDRQARSV